MANFFFNSVRITNFKSLKDVTLSDCKRINLLIGKPNVGKSNILEALGLFGLGHFRLNQNEKLTQFIRFEDVPELFFDADVNTVPSVDVNLFRFGIGNHYKSCRIKYINPYTENMDSPYFVHKKILAQLSSNESNEDASSNENFLLAIQFFGDNFRNDDAKPYDELMVNNNLNLTTISGEIFPVRQYKFLASSYSGERSIPVLIPPFGSNILQVIQTNKKLREDLSRIFAEYGLKPLIDKTSHSLRLMKVLSEDSIISFPISSIADTLQRLIFFKAAIASNENSILLFEEPETHCFPPYITHIAREIIDSESNQFFIATHSPYILDTFLEKDRDDLAIYMADFKDGQTVIKRLTDAELNDVYEYGLDLFFNAELFTDEI
ncbi:MAG: ATPase [Methylobacter sp.]|nr:MAG: ATPase [Methylobacter sp.]